MPEPPILAIILDGVGDRPHPDHDDKTPLQVADTPHLDELAAQGSTGLIDPLGPGIVPGSGTGHLGLFGYDPLSSGSKAPSRGCIEALGLGIEPAPGRVALRGNFVTLDAGGDIVDRRAGRFKDTVDQEEATQLIEELDRATPDGVAFRYHPRMGYRFVVLLEEASPKVEATDPGGTGVPPKDPRPLTDEDQAQATADRLREALKLAQDVLSDNELNEARAERGAPVANGIVTRGPGPLVRGETLQERWGITCQAIAGGNAYRGIAGYMGMSLTEVPGATGDLKTDYTGKVRAAVDAVDGGADLAFLHIKSPDICGENGDFPAKVQALERIDAALAPVAEREDLVVGLTGDHSTPCIRGAHSGDPVPLIVRAPTGRVDAIDRYDEAACARGGLGRLQGGDFLHTLLDLSDRTKKRE